MKAFPRCEILIPSCFGKMKNIARFMLVLSVLTMVGCRDAQRTEAEKLAEAARQSFATSPEPLKSRFEDLKSAIAAGDFAKAKAALDVLRQSQLSAEQQAALTEQEQSLVLKASAAAQNGDAKALELIQSLRAARRSR